ncbi:MAG: A24 family peptidase [Nocardiaceae bacterium]|nr:A24 family peptidase [Nocardiaceae bacterium]
MAFTLFAVWCLALSVIDLRQLRLPNRLTLPGGLMIVCFGAWSSQLRAVLVGAGLLFAIYLLAHLVSPSSLGAGDVKVALGLGGAAALAGPHAWVVAAVLAPLITAVVGVLFLRRRPVPHGPSMCAATVFAILWCS